MPDKCHTHPAELAGWRCSACRAALCAQCTGWKPAGNMRVECCALCGGFASQLKVSRGELHPFSLAQLLRALRWPFGGAGLISLFACTLVVSGLAYLGPKAAAIGVGAMIAYLFQIVRHTALGHDDFPGPEDFRGYSEDVVGPTWRLAVALAWIWLPAAIWTFTHRPPAPPPEDAVQAALRPGGPGLRMHGMKVVGSPTGFEVTEANAAPQPPTPEQEEQLRAEEAAQEQAQAEAAQAEPAPEPPKPSPVVPALFVLFGVLIAPMSLLASALKTPLRIAANPLVLAGYAVRLGRDYVLLVAFCAAAALGMAGVRALGHGPLAAVPFSRLPVNAAILVLAFVAFRAIGLLVRARGGDLGYGDADAYLVPVLGDARPAYVAPPPPPPEPVDLAPPPAIELAPPGLPELVAARDFDACAALLEASPAAASLLTAQAWLDLAKAVAGRNKATAVALRRCIDADPQGPLAPKAWLLAARLYDEKIGDRATSTRLLQECAKRFPDSPEGKFAAKRLAATA